MKYAKMLALAAIAAGALMAFIGAGTASATVLCSTTVEPCPAGQKWAVNTVIDFSIPSGQSALLVNTAGETIDTCTGSTVRGKITNAGSAESTVTGLVEDFKTEPSGTVDPGLGWENCTFPTKTLRNAALEVHKIAGTSNGTVTSDAVIDTIEGKEVKTIFEVTINTVLFGSCVYGVPAGKSIGDITEGNPAIFHANAVAEKLSGSNFACPATSKWTATYQLTSPGTTLSVGNS